MTNKDITAKARNLHAPMLERFGRYIRLDDSGCWIWIAAKNDKGYGVLGRGRRIDGIGRAHRLSYEFFHCCNLNPEQCVCHICDNPPCVNPHHLFVGSNLDNIKDMIAKGRHKLPPIKYGEESSNAKLNNEKVKIIRSLAKAGLSSRKIARMFEVSKSTILKIINKKLWGHLS